MDEFKISGIYLSFKTVTTKLKIGLYMGVYQMQKHKIIKIYDGDG
jgi:hypothetical protein